jgi:TRAP-type C4-dicarboxylate transport system permease small subunit
MTETLAGLGMLLAGFLMAIFSAPIARCQNAMNKRALGFELPFAWVRGSIVFIGALLSFSGLLALLRLPPI